MSDNGPGYPEDWQEQGWCCRECAVLAWLPHRQSAEWIRKHPAATPRTARPEDGLPYILAMPRPFRSPASYLRQDSSEKERP